MEQKRLTASERQGLMHMFTAVQAMAELDPLKRRIESIPGCKRLVNGSLGMLRKAATDIMSSMPLEQVKSVKRNLPGLRYTIAITDVNGKRMKDDGLWLSFDALDALAFAVKDHCLTCTKNTEEQRKCQLSKALDELPCVNADTEARGCPYFGGLY
jgi:hypothetical protein